MASRNLINDFETSQLVSSYFTLPNNVISHAAKLGTKTFCGNDVVNVICVIANHINVRVGKAWPSIDTIIRESRVPEAAAIIDRAVASGLLERVTWNKRTAYSFLSSDGPTPGYRAMSVEWWAAHVHLGKSRGFLQQLLAVANGHHRFTVNVKKDLLIQLGVSRAGFYRLLAALVECGKVRTLQQGRATEFEMLDVPRKKAVRTVSVSVSDASQRAASVSADVPQADCLSVSKDCRSVSATGTSVSETPSSVSSDLPKSFTGKSLWTEGSVIQDNVLQVHLEQEIPKSEQYRTEQSGSEQNGSHALPNPKIAKPKLKIAKPTHKLTADEIRAAVAKKITLTLEERETQTLTGLMQTELMPCDLEAADDFAQTFADLSGMECSPDAFVVFLHNNPSHSEQLSLPFIAAVLEWALGRSNYWPDHLPNAETFCAKYKLIAAQYERFYEKAGYWPHETGDQSGQLQQERYREAPLCATCGENKTNFADEYAFSPAVGENGFYLNCDECDPPSRFRYPPPDSQPSCDKKQLNDYRDALMWQIMRETGKRFADKNFQLQVDEILGDVMSASMSAGDFRNAIGAEMLDLEKEEGCGYRITSNDELLDVLERIVDNLSGNRFPPRQYRTAPSTFTPNAEHSKLAQKLGLDLNFELRQFQNRYVAAPGEEGLRKAEETFEYWLLNAKDFFGR